MPCFTLRKDKIVRHVESRMHRDAVMVEAEHSAGGIRQVFQDAVTLEMKAAVGCCKCIYFLCKQEIAHTTTYPHLLTLAENLGCEYLKALNVGRNANDLADGKALTIVVTPNCSTLAERTYIPMVFTGGSRYAGDFLKFRRIPQYIYIELFKEKVWYTGDEETLQ